VGLFASVAPPLEQAEASDMRRKLIVSNTGFIFFPPQTSLAEQPRLDCDILYCFSNFPFFQARAYIGLPLASVTLMAVPDCGSLYLYLPLMGIGSTRVVTSVHLPSLYLRKNSFVKTPYLRSQSSLYASMNPPSGSLKSAASNTSPLRWVMYWIYPFLLSIVVSEYSSISSRCWRVERSYFSGMSK